ncbi:MAG TPA: choline/ethanolamine kinase family protein [Planctomycetota bacterium]|nr:choline/ethanolamine kinase family protein [Planctomycetota bacterium]HQB00810.1 choline/ethanolamine kinase family protein [Planctomycetota bacterium]
MSLLNYTALEFISQVFQCDIKDIKNIQAMKNGMTNDSYVFDVDQKRYIIRIPGKGSAELVNRKMEYNVYQTIAEYNITDPMVYLSAENSYKITEYLDNVQNCDPRNWEEVEISMNALRAFHNLKLTMDYSFAIYDNIEKYDKLIADHGSEFSNYQENKEKAYELRDFIQKYAQPFYLSHIDSNHDNFLLNNQQNQVFMIDWEYAGMQDQDLDIAMFTIYAGYNKEEFDKLICIYCQGKCKLARRLKIYAYACIAGFLWGIWAEYKKICGVDFGDYTNLQYSYIENYYPIIKEEMKNI